METRVRTMAQCGKSKTEKPSELSHGIYAKTNTEHASVIEMQTEPCWSDLAGLLFYQNSQCFQTLNFK
jgi:hypothetical protein